MDKIQVRAEMIAVALETLRKLRRQIPLWSCLNDQESFRQHLQRDLEPLLEELKPWCSTAAEEQAAEDKPEREGVEA